MNRRGYFLVVFTFFCFSVVLQGQNDFWNVANSTGFRSGIGVGSAIAIVASWSRNKSVLWAILHAILGWLYVTYYVITRAIFGA